MSLRSNTSESTPTNRHHQVQAPRLPSCSFVRPRVIFYRCLDVIMKKHSLALEMVTFALGDMLRFLEDHQDSPDLASLLEVMKGTSEKESEDDPNTPTIVEGMSQEARESIVRYVRYKSADEQHRISIGGNNYDCKNLIKWIVLEGVLVGRFVATIDSSVVDTLHYWRDQRVVQVMLSTITHQLDTTVSGTPVSLLSSTSQGDITSLFNVSIDRFAGPSYMGPYEALIQAIGMPPKDVLLVTSNSIEALSAAKAGLMVAKVREHPQRKLYSKRITLIDDIAQIRLA